MAFTNEMWTATTLEKIVQDQMTYQRVLGAVTDLTPLVEDQTAHVLHVPNYTGLSVVDLSGATSQTTSNTPIDITFNKEKCIPVTIGRNVSGQTEVNFFDRYTSNAGALIPADWDKQIVTAIFAAKASTAIAGAAFTEAEILAARSALNAAGAPIEGRYLIVGPTLEAGLYGLTNFISADRVGGTDAVKNGFIGRVYGFNVILYNDMPAAAAKDQAIFLQSSAVCFAAQKTIDVMVGTDATKYADVVNFVSLYGVTVANTDFIVTKKQA